ncbi:hypothetical protein LSTR_LSTR002020 [Laodelphax striatellus]|uniref:Uncharacterized protein n=1 Tax=Laodelphax striatellus TaxID=195883 RepID=A0A482XHS4_LAOST|nr:hypothetical protein LSTR_LSTR002020 [Laodelphax striatellus]
MTAVLILIMTDKRIFIAEKRSRKKRKDASNFRLNRVVIPANNEKQSGGVEEGSGGLKGVIPPQTDDTQVESDASGGDEIERQRSRFSKMNQFINEMKWTVVRNSVRRLAVMEAAKKTEDREKTRENRNRTYKKQKGT